MSGDSRKTCELPPRPGLKVFENACGDIEIEQIDPTWTEDPLSVTLSVDDVPWLVEALRAVLAEMLRLRTGDDEKGAR